MNNKISAQLEEKLLQQEKNNNLRTLKVFNTENIDFSSNDYLGFAKREFSIEKEINSKTVGSRLIAGTTEEILNIEKKIADFHQYESALLFPSGYMANLGLLQCIANKGDTIVYDELCHASIRDGIRLSFANAYSFSHNSIEDLERKISKSVGTIYVVTELVFSMDGTLAPIEEIDLVCQKYGAALLIDEAHSVGIYGEQGRGVLSNHKNLQNVLAVVYTYGKAFGYSGASICGSKVLTDYLVNFCRSFIYTTGVSEAYALELWSRYEAMQSADGERSDLMELIQYFRSLYPKSKSHTAIQPIIIGDNLRCLAKEELLLEEGFNVKAIRKPTVKEGTERLRISLHSYNTKEEINKLLGLLVE
jgi:8-amino-7-oxononanoate synthase